MTKRLILMAGNIGAGKTSLTDRIGERLGWMTAYESVVDNPYLPDFYESMKDWSFHLQIYFLGHRAEQHIHLPQAAIVLRTPFLPVRSAFPGCAEQRYPDVALCGRSRGRHSVW